MKAIGMYIFGGSQTIGHMQAGWEVDKVLEMTENMTEINAYHFTKNYPDIKIVKPSEWSSDKYIEDLKNEHYDLLFANPPCSGLSSLNRNASVDSDVNNHIFEVINMIDSIKPKMFFIENAPTLTNLGLPILKKVVNQLKGNYKFTIINDIAGNHNVAMHRKRTFVIGWNRQYFNDIIPRINECKEPMMTLSKCLEGLSDSTPNMELDNKVQNPQFFKYYHLVKQGESIDYTLAIHFDEIKSELDERSLKHIEKFKLRLDTKDNIWDKSSWRLKFDEQVQSMSSLAQFMHPTENRDLYIREYARIMGYPDDFIFYPNECKCKTVQCLSQGVPVNFIKYISNEMKMCYNNKCGISNADVQYINQVSDRKEVNFTFEEFMDCSKINENNRSKKVNRW